MVPVRAQGQCFLGSLMRVSLLSTQPCLQAHKIQSNLTLAEMLPAEQFDQQPELANKGIAMPMPMPLQANTSTLVLSDSGLSHPLPRPLSDAQSTDCLMTGETLNQQEDLMIEGGTINISSVYSQGLLNTLTQSLQSTGVDLSQANISVQIDLGKRANRRPMPGTPIAKDHENPPSSNQARGHLRETSSGEGSDQTHKRLKT